ncbi:MAG TPA: tRNA (adenine-N1)-methyltransferase [Nitrososphaerales archaeon]
MVLTNLIQEGDYVILYLSKQKQWLVKAKKGEMFHTHRGIIGIESIIGLEYGSSVTTTLNEKIWLLKPIIKDFILKSERKTQIIYPKDLGIIASWTGLSSGKIVVESGTGSGALTIFAASLVCPEGHVYSYEVRPEFKIIAERNIAKSGLSKYISLKLTDAKEGIDITGADIALIDVGDPWTLVEPMRKALKGSGSLAAVSPTMNQVEKLTIALQNTGFTNIENMEVIVRDLEAREGMTRPSMRMIGHTAYLTFARKIL